MREKLIELIRDAKYDVDRICVERDWCDGCPAAHGEGDCKEAYIADHLIANDVITVVRCKECKYSSCNPVKLTYGCNHPSGLRGFIHEGFYFCSYGERKGNEKG